MNLFANPFQLNDHKKTLEGTFNPIGCGTPGRILKLCQIDALNLSATRYIIIDLLPNEKNFTCLTLPGVAKDLMTFFKEYANPYITTSEKNHIKLVFF